MSLLFKMRAFISELDRGEFRKFIVIYLAIFLVCVGFLFFYYTSSESTIKKQIKDLNESRGKVQKILSDYQKVFLQKEAIAQLFSEDKNFYLQQFVQGALKTAQITNNVVGTVSSQQVSGYTEESVSIQTTGINTQQLCQLLQNIEQASRVFVKHVTINREEKATTISASMVVATFKPNGG